MKSSYEIAEVLELGQAPSLIMGVKVVDPLYFENELGPGMRFDELDIDESDE